MFCVYLLQSQKYRRFYTGLTSDIEKRLKEHNLGLVKSTKAYKPYNVIYKEYFENKTTARKREIELKEKGAGEGKDFI